MTMTTTHTAIEPFTASCGHGVLAGNQYIVKRDGVAYCSSACAGEEHEIVVRLKDEESLDDLLAGVLVFHMQLTYNGDDTYALHGHLPGGAAAQAYLRVGLEQGDTEAPALPEPTEEVANWMERLRIRLGLNGTPTE